MGKRLPGSQLPAAEGVVGVGTHPQAAGAVGSQPRAGAGAAEVGSRPPAEAVGTRPQVQAEGAGGRPR